MKFKIFVYILLLGFIIYGMFVPVDSGYTDASLLPDPETFAEDSSPSDTLDNETPVTENEDSVDEEDSYSEDSVTDEEPVNPDTLSPEERLIYDWSMTHDSPDSILLTRDQIQILNNLTADNCESVIDILSLPSSMPTDTVLGYIKNTVYPELPKYNDGTAITDSDMTAIIENMNASGEVAEMTLGIITNRTSLRSMPTDMHFFTSAEDHYYDQIQISALYCSMPVWILHTSADEDWFYVQTYFARGWVHAKDVAIAPSADVWQSYAAPEHSVVITQPQMTLDGTLVDMGCVFTCLEDTGSSFNIVIPVRDKKGMLSAKEATVSYDDAHKGYLDYTWTNFYKQVFKYQDFAYGWGDADGGVDAASFPGYVMRSFGILLPRDLELQTATFGSALPLADLTDSEKPTALETLHLPSLLYYGDKVSLYLGCMDGVHYEIYAPQATETIRYNEFTYWDRLTDAVVIN